MKTGFPIAVGAIVLLLMLTWAFGQTPQPSPPFSVGIVQRNGDLDPLIAFNGKDWAIIALVHELSTFTENQYQTTGEWTLWYEDSGHMDGQLSPVRIELATTGVISYEATCSAGPGARTRVVATDAEDLSESREACSWCCPEDMRGIATTSKSRPDLVSSLDAEGCSIEARQVKAWLLRAFNELEFNQFEKPYREYDENTESFVGTGKTLAEHLEPHWSAEERRDTRLKFLRFSRIQGDDATYYYFDVKRSYAPHLHEGSAVLMGWVRDTGDEMAWLTQKFSLIAGSPKISRDKPLLFWRHGGFIDVLVRQYWWEGGQHRLIRIEGDSVEELAAWEFW